MNVERTALVRAIHHELAEATVVFGSQIDAAADLLADGAELVVAADGVGSRLRPGASQPARLRKPWTVWQAVVPGGGDLIEPMGSAIVLAPHHFLGIYRQPNRELCWFLEDPSLPDDATAADVLEVLSHDEDTLVRKVVEVTPPEVFGKWLARDRWPTASRLTGDRLVAVGDAAHPMLPCAGQGACTSMEDGVALAVSLRTGSVPAALEEYRRLRLRTSQWRVASSHLGCTTRRPSPLATSVAATPLGIPFARVAGIGLRLNGRGDRRLLRAISWNERRG
jgi:2-polyprenyl-6-methoxyphenol hydroxylase-like FAD-dependent oxidoreductase